MKNNVIENDDVVPRRRHVVMNKNTQNELMSSQMKDK